MLRSARFALIVGLSGLSATIPVLALDPPQKHNQNKAESKEDKKKAEPAKKENPPDNPSDDRLDRRNSRMKERNREIDGLLNKQKK